MVMSPTWLRSRAHSCLGHLPSTPTLSDSVFAGVIGSTLIICSREIMLSPPPLLRAPYLSRFLASRRGGTGIQLSADRGGHPRHTRRQDPTLLIYDQDGAELTNTVDPPEIRRVCRYVPLYGRWMYHTSPLR